ncbi:MAG: class I SAM-dependent methyltransferase [Candidatus Omnitrophica bacterium]|nr:class I SAM-dependent methyltransferase [Candidatus Omnitrophota bacterium]
MGGGAPPQIRPMTMIPAATTRQQRERRHFDRLALESGAIWWGSETPAGLARMRRRARLIFERLQGQADPALLELGAGAGALSKQLLQMRPSLRLTGCDISPESIRVASEQCAQYPNVRMEVADVTAMPYPQDAFDAVIANSVLHHLPVEPALRECLRVLRSGGFLWMSEPNMMNPQVALERNVRWVGRRMQNSEDETAFFRWPLARQLRRIGFSQVGIRPFDFLHPSIPPALIPVFGTIGQWVERLPLLREISGSLLICGRKP